MYIKKVIPILLFFHLCLIGNLFGQVRTKQLINRNWKFKLNEQNGAEQVNYDDSEWKTVQLPHDASIYGPFVRDTLGGNAADGYRPRHIGWYRKHLKIKKVDTTKEYKLEFEGVYRAARVWVNGKYCGQSLGEVLDAIALSLNVHYTKKDSTIIFISNNI
jgi:beta-galactosidase